jgi:hypothetical protein
LARAIRSSIVAQASAKRLALRGIISAIIGGFQLPVGFGSQPVWDESSIAYSPPAKHAPKSAKIKESVSAASLSNLLPWHTKPAIGRYA